MEQTITQWYATAARWWQIAEQTTPPWVRLVLAGGLGAIVAVFLGWVDLQGGDGIKIYLALVGVVVASSASFLSARVINEIADRRQIRRKALAVELRLDALTTEVELLLQFADAFVPAPPSNLPDDDQALEIITWANRIREVAASPPNFDDVVNSAADLFQADRTLARFRYFASVYAHGVTPDMPEVERQIISNAYMQPDQRDILRKSVAHLNEAKAHFSKYAGPE